MKNKQKRWKKAPTPEEVINEAIKREDWFSAFSNAVTYFEHWGYWKLRWYCIEEEIDIKERLRNLRVGTLTTILYILKLIDENTFSKMITIIKERNGIIHPTSKKGRITYRGKKEKDRAVQLLEDAKYCIRKLKEGILKERIGKR